MTFNPPRHHPPAFAPLRARILWRRTRAEYLYLWPDGLFRRVRPCCYGSRPARVEPGVCGPWWLSHR